MMNEPSPQTVTYGRRRFYLVAGALCTLFFVAMGVGSSAAAYWNVDGSFRYPKLCALVFALVWSWATSLGVAMLLAYFRERLVLGPTAVTQHGVFRTTTARIPEIQQIKWRLLGRGRVVISTRQAKMKVRLDNFTFPEEREIIAFFHESFAPEIQLDWPRFEEHRRQFAVERPAPSRSYRVTTGLVFAVFAIVFAGVG